MRLLSFNGGLNIRQAPHLIPVEQAVVFENIDNNKGHFCPIKDKLLFPLFEGQEGTDYAYNFGEELYWTETLQDFIVYKEQLYRADRVGVPQKRVAPYTFRNLGIAGPTTAPVITADPVVDPEEATVRTYAVTFYNTVDGSESMPVFSSPVDYESGTVSIASIPVSDDEQVNARRIYRLGGDLTNFTLLVTLFDNETTSYVDSSADVDIAGNAQLESTTYGQAPAGLKYLTEAYSMLFGILGDKLYYTPIGRPNAWPALNYIDLPNDGTGIGVTTAGLLVFTRTKTILVTGTGPDTLAQQSLSEDQGCISHDTISNIRGMAVWCSKDGICASDGGVPEVVSKSYLGRMDLTDTAVSATTFDESYYLQLNDGRALIWDIPFGGIFKYENYNTTFLLKVNYDLFGISNKKVYQIYAGAGVLTAKWKSGWLGEGGLVQEKIHDRILIAYKGPVTLKIYIDEALALTKQLNSSKFKMDHYKLPDSFTRGVFIELELEGTGEVYEISFPEESANG